MNSMQWNYRAYLDIWMTTDDIPLSCSLIHIFSFYFQSALCVLWWCHWHFFFNYKSNYIRQLKFRTRQKSKSSLCSTFWILLRDSLIAQKNNESIEWNDGPCCSLCNSSLKPILFLGWTGGLHFTVLALAHICHQDQSFILASSVLFAWLAQLFQNWKSKCIKW